MWGRWLWFRGAVGGWNFYIIAHTSTWVELFSLSTIFPVQTAHAVADIKVEIRLSRTVYVDVTTNTLTYVIVKNLLRKAVFVRVARTLTFAGGRNSYLEESSAFWGTSTWTQRFWFFYIDVSIGVTVDDLVSPT